MTNEEAIKYINSEFNFDSKAVALARMFAMEDIIEFDVLEWCKMPVSAGLSEFIEHCKNANEMVIPQYTSGKTYTPLDMEGALRDLSEKMETVMLAMQVYTDIHSNIREKVSEKVV